MAAIPEQIIEQIRESVDIADVIGAHVGLKRSGKQFKGLCPFHDEKSPSFYVDPVRRSFKCFGCGAWGDVFDFVQKVEGVGFLAAVRSLGARVGVALPDQSTGDVRRAEARERERELAYRVNAAAADLYRRLLTEAPVGEAGRAYQRERGIDEAVAESFRIGYAPAPDQAGWDTLVRELEAQQLPLEMAETLGLVVRSPRGGHYDRLRGRLMFTIVQPGGRVLGFSGRILPSYAEHEDGQKAPKYVNSPESLLYKKSRTLFGIHAAGSAMRQRERGVLVEGQIDVVAMHQRGYVETVAPLGTALTKPQCELLARFTSTIVLCFDGDQAGAKAAYAALPLLLEVGMDVRMAALEPGEDPDSTPPEQLDNLLRAPGSALEWLIKRMVAKGARQSIDAQAKALRALVPLLRAVRGRDARGDYANLAADMLQIPARRIWAAVEGKAAAEAPRERYAGRPRKSGHARNSPSGRARSVAPAQRFGSAPDFDSGFEPEFDGGVDPAIEAEFIGFAAGPPESLYAPGLGPSPRPQDFVARDQPRDLRAVERMPADASQFSAGMTHSAAMRPVQPLPSGQASVTALLVDRPELARLAEREGVFDRVTDPRLAPIVRRTIEAAKNGERQPSTGELLELVEPQHHGVLQYLLAPVDPIPHIGGPKRPVSFADAEDPKSSLMDALALCERERLEHEVRALEQQISDARSRGDLDVVKELVQKRMAASQRKSQLSLRRA